MTDFIKIILKSKLYLFNQPSHPWLKLLFIPLIVFVTYSNIYNSPFVFDDIQRIVENKIIKDVSNYYSLSKILKPRGIVDFTFAINYHFGKLNVFGYHLVNVVIHVLNSFLVYFLSLTIFKQLSISPISLKEKSVFGEPGSLIRTAAIFSSLVFAAHPIQTQAVTYISQRYASMAAMFFMASVLFYLHARIIQQREKNIGGVRGEKKNRIRKIKLVKFYILSSFCGILAFLCKQNTASLPGVILLGEYLLFDQTWQGWKKKTPWFFLFIGLWVIFILYIAGFFVSGFEGRGILEDVSDIMKETEAISRLNYLYTQFNVLVIYLRLLFLPINQNLDYFYPFKSGFFDGLTPMAFIILTTVACIGVWSIKKRPAVTFSIFWFFITLSVESSIIPIRDALFEHRLYLPMFGFGLVIIFLIFDLLSKRRFVAFLLSFAIIILFGATTYHRNGVWKNDVTIWADVVSKSTQNPRGYNNYGNAMYYQGHMEKAIEQYMTALRIKPDFANARNNLGSAIYKQGDTKEAVYHYLVALRLKPDFEKAHNNIGVAFNELGRTEKAINHYLLALRKKPDYEEAQYNLGLALKKQGRMDEAIEHFLDALRINPYNEKTHTDLGIALYRKGRFLEAFNHFSEALKIKDDFDKAHYNLGLALYNQGRKTEGIKHYMKALKINPANVEAHYNLGLALQNLDRLDGAMVNYFKVLRLQPDYVDAYNNLAIVLYRKGNIEGAISNLRKALLINPYHVNAKNNLIKILKKQKNEILNK
jgi:protein O-mannosyl-transferase